MKRLPADTEWPRIIIILTSKVAHADVAQIKGGREKHRQPSLGKIEKTRRVERG